MQQAMKDIGNQNDSPVLVTYEEAATALRCSVRTIFRLVAEGKIRPIRLRNAVRIDLQEVLSDLRKAGEADAQ